MSDTTKGAASAPDEDAASPTTGPQPADTDVAEAEAGGIAGAAQPDVSPIELAQLEPEGGVGAVGNLELLRDIELSVTVEVGRARLRVRDLLALHEGSIVGLDRPVGSPVDLLANGRTIARGEIVLVDDHLGIRVTSFSSDSDSD
jgi:flagellar motor switch protein FliN/FliY